MKKILLICSCFYPKNVIGAVRTTKVAQKLTDRGFQVDVYTEMPLSNTEAREKGLCNYVISYGEKEISSSVKCSKKYEYKKIYEFKIYKWISHFYNGIVDIKKSKDVTTKFINDLKDVLYLKDNKYDVVITSYMSLSTIFCGLYYKRLHPDVQWICEFRDPIVTKYSNVFLRPYYKYIQNKACKNADNIIAVSQGYLERICSHKYKNKSYMIPNGFDKVDLDGKIFTDKKNQAMTLIYVGSLYGGDRDFSPVFKAISELVKEGKIKQNKVCMYYAGTEHDVIVRQAKKYNVENIIVNKGFLSREECLNIQCSSDILMLSTWNEKKEYGVFPGKFLEYMLIGKPILSITGGNLADGEVTSVMKEGNLGFAYEEINDKEDYPKLKRYIENAYLQWENTGKVKFEPNQKVIDRYDYKNIIRKFEDIING